LLVFLILYDTAFKFSPLIFMLMNIATW
jgi:hypothetical protein